MINLETMQVLDNALFQNCLASKGIMLSLSSKVIVKYYGML